ncbi:hypothetical protein F383_20554 [Gossypium arboreum]|uniref:Uncharacterized protein n=1 Tax=Gossypium arboreum TaxID=29729 RepID=A0A0B0NJK2_GOSAR|nr:hypothetical protein F383_20554 [Gossypium arboreum]
MVQRTFREMDNYMRCVSNSGTFKMYTMFENKKVNISTSDDMCYKYEKICYMCK